MSQAATSATTGPPPLRAQLERGAELCRAAGRDDLVLVLEAAAARISRPETVIAVVGEFKQGKSSLINALLGEPVCPVDDDIATATITVLRHGERPAARIHHRGEDGDSITTTAIDDFPRHVLERTGGEERGVSMVEVVLPNPFLASGITLVDTPGVGGLNPGYLGMTLAYIRAADAIIFVSDASSPLTAAEVEFLASARERCPVALAVLAKVDMFPDWQKVREIIAGQLADASIAIPLFPVSSFLRGTAFERGRSDLNDRSGYPALLSALNEQVLAPSAAVGAARAEADLDRALGQLELSMRAEIEGLERPGDTETLERLTRAKERFDRLRSSAARWSTVLNDGFTDLVADVEHGFRSALRELSREVEERVEQGDPQKDWEELTAEVRDRVARAADDMVTGLEQGAANIAREIQALLREEDVDIGELAATGDRPDVGGLWLGKEIDQPGIVSRVGTGYAGLRGAQGGILVFGMMANLAGIALSTMALAGIGIVLGGKQIFEERRRQVSNRRQQARLAIRQFLDDVQFAVSKDMRDLSRVLQRRLRDHFSERIAELTRTYAETADALQKSQRQSEAERAARLKELGAQLENVRRLQQIARAGKPA